MIDDNFHDEYRSGYNACIENFREECKANYIVKLCFHENFKKNSVDFDCGWTDALIEIAKKGQKL